MSRTDQLTYVDHPSIKAGHPQHGGAEVTQVARPLAGRPRHPRRLRLPPTGQQQVRRHDLFATADFAFSVPLLISIVLPASRECRRPGHVQGPRANGNVETGHGRLGVRLYRRRARCRQLAAGFRPEHLELVELSHRQLRKEANGERAGRPIKSIDRVCVSRPGALLIPRNGPGLKLLSRATARWTNSARRLACHGSGSRWRHAGRGAGDDTRFSPWRMQLADVASI
jgi:hypothetical protein